MKNFDTINTNSWSNIPKCIIHAINLLVEKSAKNTSEIEEIKSSISDLIIKFQVKTTRIDSTVQELTAGFKTFQSLASKDIEELQRRTEENSTNTEKKHKFVSEVINELKNKQATFYGEFRKEIRELNNKIEKHKTDTDEFLEDQIDRIRRHVEGIESHGNQRMNILHEEMNTGVEDLLKKIKKVEELEVIQRINLTTHEELINMHTVNLHKVIDQCNGHSGKLEAANESITSMADVIEALSKPVSVTVAEPSPRQKERKPSEAFFISPLIAKLQDLDEKIEQMSSAHKASIQNIENSNKLELASTKYKIESWVNDQISSQIDENFSKLKTKLEWLPEKSEEMKGMNVTEARLFMIESRIRGEEKARILSDQKLQTDLVGLKEVSNIRSQHRRASLSPHETKLNTFEGDKKTRKRIKIRPSSGHPYREIVTSQEKLKEKFNIKVESC